MEGDVGAAATAATKATSEGAKAAAVEAAKAAIDLSYKMGEYAVSIKIDNIWLAAAVAFGGLSVAAFYIHRKYPAQRAIRNALEKNYARGVVDPEVRSIEEGSILVKLVCHTEQSFLLFMNDFKAMRIKHRVKEEFQKIGYEEELEVTITNWDEVNKKLNHIRINTMAIPLCVPNNWRWNSVTGINYNQTGEGSSSLYVVDEALQKLRSVRGPVCVVSIAGSSRHGKSYLLSNAFDQPEVFSCGHLLYPESMGIWMWIVPQTFLDSNGQEYTVVLLDSEGIDAVRGEGLDDAQIFTLTVLLSSVLIYTSSGVPKKQYLDYLDFITKLPQRIRHRSNSEGSSVEDTGFFHKTFPSFIWLLRDITQSLPSYYKNINDYFLTKVFREHGMSCRDPSQDVGESILRFFSGFQAFMLPPPSFDITKHQLLPRYLDEMDQFKRLLRSTLVPKRSFNDGEVVTGEGLAALVQLYVDAMNTPGVIPNIQIAWETFVTTKCSEALQAALDIYDFIMQSELSGQLPCKNDKIRQNHEVALKKGITKLEGETFELSAVTTEKYLRELTETFDKRLAFWESENENFKTEGLQQCSGATESKQP